MDEEKKKICVLSKIGGSMSFDCLESECETFWSEQQNGCILRILGNHTCTYLLLKVAIMAGNPSEMNKLRKAAGIFGLDIGALLGKK